ncbi:MAG: low specificity L-threonine aldolase, partial [Ancylobacter novellus]
NARAANSAAARLDAGLRLIAGVEVQGAVEANMLFVRLPQPMIEGLLRQGFRFYTDRWGPGVVRLVTSFLTTSEDVDRLL